MLPAFVFRSNVMLLSLFARSLEAYRTKHPSRRRHSPRLTRFSFRPCIESLEDRAVPSAVSWVGPSGGDWDTPANWSTGNLPGPADDVQISSALQVNHTSGNTEEIHSLSTVANSILNLTSGALCLDAASTLNGNFNLSNASLEGAGAVTLNGSFSWQGGNVGNYFRANHGSGAVTVNGALTISGDNLTERLQANRVLTTNGPVSWSGNSNFIQISGNSSWVNNGSFAASTNTALQRNDEYCTFTNAGTFTCSSPGVLEIQVTFINQNAVVVQSGTLQLEHGGNTAGSAPTFTASPGAFLAFENGIYTLQTATPSTPVLHGGGTVRIFDNPTLRIDGSVTDDATDTSFTGGTLSGSGTITFADQLDWIGATMNGAGVTNVTGTLNLPGNGNNSTETLDTRTLNTSGTALWSGTNNTIQLTGPATWLNTGVFNAAGDNAMNVPGGTGYTQLRFINAAGATFKKTAGTTSTDISVPFNNSGTVDVQAAKLNLILGGTSGSTGLFLAEPGTHLAFPNALNTTNFTGGTALGGGGTVDFNGGTVVVSGTVTDNATTTTLSSGTLTGNGTFTVNNTLLWTGGQMLGQGTTLVNTQVISNTLVPAVLNVDTTSNSVTLDTRTLTIKGQMNWVAGGNNINLNDGAVLSTVKGTIGTTAYTGAFNIQVTTNTSINNSGYTASILNQGNLTKTAASTGQTAIGHGGYVELVNSGTVTVAGGQLSLQGGGVNTKAVSLASGATLEFPNTYYALAGGTNISGQGTVLLDGGTVDVTGTASVSAAVAFSQGTLEGGGSLTVSGAFAWMGGTMIGSGTTTISGPLQLSTANTSVTLDGRSLKTTSSASTWAGNNNTFNLRDGAVYTNSGTLTVSGTENLNNAGGVGTPFFVNTGTLTTSGSGALLTVNVPVTNTGTIRVSNATTINLRGGGTNSKNLTIGTGTGAPNTILEVSEGTFVFTTGTAVSGPGTLQLDPGFNGTRVLAIEASMIIPANVVMTGGSLFVDGTTLTVSKEMDWSGGTMTGSGAVLIAQNTGVLKIQGNATTEAIDTATLSIAGSATWSGTGNGIVLYNGAVLQILASGTFTAQNDEVMTHSGNGGSLRSVVWNFGHFTKSAGAGGNPATALNLPFNNAGTLTVAAGNLLLQDGGDSSTAANSFIVSGSSATLGFQYGTMVLGNTTIKGPGQVQVLSATLNVNGAVTEVAGGNLLLKPTGTIGGDGPSSVLTLNGAFHWTGGTINGDGVLNNYGNFLLESDGTGEGLTSRQFNNYATVTWSGENNNFFINTGAVFTNVGTFTVRNNQLLGTGQGGPGIFHNLGKFIKDVDTETNMASTTEISLPFNNDGTATIKAGIVQLDYDGNGSGTFSMAAGTLLRFSGGQGPGIATLTSATAITGAGSVEVDYADELDVTGYQIGGSTSITGGGTLHVFGNSQTGTFSNNGGLAVISDGAVFRVTAGNYVQGADLGAGLTGGETDLENATMTFTAGGMVDVRSGSFYGLGTINGSFQNAGVLYAGGGSSLDGQGIGVLTINGGNYQQTSSGDLVISLSGTGFDQLVVHKVNGVGGTANLAGAVSVDYVFGNPPPNSATFTFLSASSLGGDFTSFFGTGTFQRGTSTYSFKTAS
jgi:hypothetical protein